MESREAVSGNEGAEALMIAIFSAWVRVEGLWGSGWKSVGCADSVTSSVLAGVV